MKIVNETRWTIEEIRLTNGGDTVEAIICDGDERRLVKPEYVKTLWMSESKIAMLKRNGVLDEDYAN